MRIAFVHQYFPGQFARLARHFVAEGHEVVAFHRGVVDGRSSEPVAGVHTLAYGEDLPPRQEGILGATLNSLREAAAMAEAAVPVARSGWLPDLVYSHTGWGSTSFLHDVFPQAKFVKYCEWYYNNTAESTEFLSPEGRPLDARMATETMNLPILADLARGDAFVSPTKWQRKQFPRLLRDRIEVVPDGIDMALFEPDPEARFTLPDGRPVGRGDRVVTYVARGADPFRGFAPFLEALALVQARDTSVQAIVLGDRTVYYGAGGGTENHFHETVAKAGIDPARTHFLGTVPYDDYRRVLQVSSAHVYLTVPFVLSWSCLEAMAAGCAVIGSDTAPVREFIENGENGLLADFSDPAEIAERISEALAGGRRIEAMRRRARKTIRKRWSAERAIESHMAIVNRLVNQRR